jgi:uncharacterized membrane protein
MTGVFFAFSVSVMPGLNAVEARSAVAAMQAINRKILSPVFFLTMFGAPVASLVAGACFVGLDAALPAAAMFAAGALYLLGAMAPTIGINVPLNRKLDRAGTPVDEAAAVTLWRAFADPWSRANVVRTGFAGISLLAATLALFWRGWSAAMMG